jgi:hypothetical protein
MRRSGPPRRALQPLLSAASYASAQVDRATLTGIVRERSDALIPKAQVTITNLAQRRPPRGDQRRRHVYLLSAPGRRRVSREVDMHDAPTPVRQ